MIVVDYHGGFFLRLSEAESGEEVWKVFQVNPDHGDHQRNGCFVIKDDPQPLASKSSETMKGYALLKEDCISEFSLNTLELTSSIDIGECSIALEPSTGTVVTIEGGEPYESPLLKFAPTAGQPPVMIRGDCVLRLSSGFCLSVQRDVRGSQLVLYDVAGRIAGKRDLGRDFIGHTFLREQSGKVLLGEMWGALRLFDLNLTELQMIEFEQERITRPNFHRDKKLLPIFPVEAFLLRDGSILCLREHPEDDMIHRDLVRIKPGGMDGATIRTFLEEVHLLNESWLVVNSIGKPLVEAVDVVA